MTFKSILFVSDSPETAEPPDFFPDLNFDQVVESIIATKEEYNLAVFFQTPLRDPDSIQYRHAVMRDMEDPAMLERIDAFAQEMILVRRYVGMVAKLDYENHRNGWFLEAVNTYCQAVLCLAESLHGAKVESRGFRAFRAYLAQYVESQVFKSLSNEARKLKSRLSLIRYCVTLKNSTVSVRKYEGEVDYSIEVERTFEKFKQGAVKDYRSSFYDGAGMNHVEAQILDLVARLYPEVFASLANFYVHHQQFFDETLRRFDREVQFYVAYLEHIAKLKRMGLNFCYPEISGADKNIFSEQGFDLALANKQRFENKPVICNDFFLRENERVIVVSGPNQGGKTTFARMFGQLHYLACLGLPVPGIKGRFFLCDQILTHFEKEEDISNLRGKLQDDLVRIHDVLRRATPDSIVIMNEIFSSTTLQDAVFLGKKVMERIVELDLLCVWVTFIDELTSYDEKTVSMVSTIVPDNPAERTFKIVRKPADGLAYAHSIAEKHGLTYGQIMERIRS